MGLTKPNNTNNSSDGGYIQSQPYHITSAFNITELRNNLKLSGYFICFGNPDASVPYFYFRRAGMVTTFEINGFDVNWNPSAGGDSSTRQYNLNIPLDFPFYLNIEITSNSGRYAYFTGGELYHIQID